MMTMKELQNIKDIKHTLEILENKDKIPHITADTTLEEMQRKVLSIAEDFDKWLEEMQRIYGISKDEIQALIKQFLI